MPSNTHRHPSSLLGLLVAAAILSEAQRPKSAKVPRQFAKLVVAPDNPNATSLVTRHIDEQGPHLLVTFNDPDKIDAELKIRLNYLSVADRDSDFDRFNGAMVGAALDQFANDQIGGIDSVITDGVMRFDSPDEFMNFVAGLG